MERFGEAAGRDLVLTTIQRLADKGGAMGSAFWRRPGRARACCPSIWAADNIDVISRAADGREPHSGRNWGLADIGALVRCGIDAVKLRAMKAEGMEPQRSRKRSTSGTRRCIEHEKEHPVPDVFQ
jgi:hypothetical protein